MTETKTLPTTVTHLDIIKTIAVIVMIIDHIGMYFFPEQLWWRAIGRAGGAPIWFFLIGYALTRVLPNRLLIGALVLVVADLALFNSVFSMNVLVTIIALRFIIDPVINFLLQSRYIFILGAVGMALAYVASKMIMEYGTLALLFAILGYLTRHYKDVLANTFFTQRDYYGFLIFTFVAFCALQNMHFQFDEVQFVIMAIVTAFVMAVLVTMKPMEFPNIKGRSTKVFLQYCGRNTLDIYVAHLLLFKVIIFTIYALK